jgi:hypothetical protein
MLLVQFGTAEHFRTDYINFVVADFNGTYHAILGRPALTKFMVVPHYSYLVLKMPTEHDVLTLRGNVYTAYTYEEEGFKVAKGTDLSIRMEQTLVATTKTPADHLEIPELQAHARASSPRTTRRSSWSTMIPARRPLSGPIWIPNRKTRLSGF